MQFRHAGHISRAHAQASVVVPHAVLYTGSVGRSNGTTCPAPDVGLVNANRSIADGSTADPDLVPGAHLRSGRRVCDGRGDRRDSSGGVPAV